MFISLISVTSILSNVLDFVHCDTVSSMPIRIVDASDHINRQFTNTPYIGSHSQPEYHYKKPPVPITGYIIYEGDVHHPHPGTRRHGGPQNWHLAFKEKQQKYYTYGDTMRYEPTRSPVTFQAFHTNTIKVYEDPLVDLHKPYRERYAENTRIYPMIAKYEKDRNNNKDTESVLFYGAGWKRGPQDKRHYGNVPQYDVHYPFEHSGQKLYPDEKIPDSFPNVFFSDTNYKPPTGEEEFRQNGPRTYSKNNGYFPTRTYNYPSERLGEYFPPREYMMSGYDDVYYPGTNSYKQKRSCRNYIRLNQQGYPNIKNPLIESLEPCGRMVDAPLEAPDFPDYSGVPFHKIPMEHRVNLLNRRTGKSVRNRRNLVDVTRLLKNATRSRRNPAYGYGEMGYGPFGGGGGGGGTSGYYGHDSNNGGFGNMYSRSNRYGQDSDEDGHSDYGSNRSLTSYITGRGRRDQSRRNRNEDDEDENGSDEENDRNNRKNDRNNGRGRNNGSHRSDDEDEDNRRGDRNNRRRNNNNSNSRRNHERSGNSGGRSRHDSYGNHDSGSVYGNNGRNYGGFDGQQDGRSFGFYG